MLSSAPVIGAVVSAILALGPTPSATSPADSADGPARPVEKIRLTTSTGAPTEVGAAALGALPLASGRAQGRPFSPLGLWLSDAPATPGGSAGESSDALVDEARVLTEPLDVSDFLVAGFTWDDSADSAEEQSFLIRVREDGTWSDWYELERDEDTRPDDADAPAGTEPFITAGATGVQILVTGARHAPGNLELVLIPEDAEGERTLDESEIETTSAPVTPLKEAEAGGEVPVLEPSWGAPTPAGTGLAAGASARLRSPLPATSTANGLPVPVVTRAEWGGDAEEPGWEAEYEPAPFVVVHHTAGTNTYTCSQSRSIVKGIYDYHSNTLGWDDIGYNFLVDKCGQAFEGRWGSIDSPRGTMVVGGHSAGFNTGSMGISMLGDYTSIAPSDQTLSTVGKIAGWHLDRAGVSPNSSGVFVSKGNSKYAKGVRVTLPRISGHRDNGYTACPGDAAYPLLWKVRRAASDAGASSTSGAGTPAAPVELSGAWVAEGGAWRFRTGSSYVKDTWARIKGEVYYLDSAGIMRAGWYEYGDSWYYFDPSSGALRTGELALQGAVYLLDARTGAMATGWRKEPVGWRYYRPSGSRAFGWLADSGSWYYLDPKTGIMQTSRRTIGGKTYLFASSGEMTTGWVLDRAGWRYYGADGAQAKAWTRVGAEYYYLDPATGIMKTGRLNLNGDTYFLASSGERQSGWYTAKGSWYYLRPGDGAMLTGWVPVKGAWYYLNPGGGAMATGWQRIGSAWYYLDASGAMRTGWLLDGPDWYYLESSGAMATGWVSIGGTWYYLNPQNGAMATGRRIINGVAYSFAPSGALR